MPAELTPEQIALEAYLAERNRKTREWMNAGPARWATTIVEEADFWAKSGVFNIEQFEHQESCCLAYEMHKDRYGFKPNYAELRQMSQLELDAYIEKLDAVELL